MQQTKEKIAYTFIIIFIISYAIAIAIFADFSVIDDHTLVETLFVGKYIPLHILPNIGRFFPLNGQDLNILSYFFTDSPSVFYTFNAIAMVLISLCILAIIKYSLPYSIKPIFYAIALFAFVVSPGFVVAFLRLFVPERMELLFLSIFMLSYVIFLRKESLLLMIIGILSSLISLFYKETAFILIGAFGFFHFIFAYPHSSKKSKIFDLAIICNCIIWLCIYFEVILMHKQTGGFYGDTYLNAFIVFSKTLLNYASDPFLIITPLGLILFKFYRILKKQDKFHPLFDASLIGAFCFIIAYIKLGMYNDHYYLPAYIFLIAPIIFYFTTYFKYIWIKSLIGICIFLYLFNSLPIAVYNFAHYKFVPKNFQSTLSFLTEYIHTHPQTNIFLEGVNRASGVEVYVSFIEWLQFYGNKDFNFTSDMPIDNPLLANPDPKSPYSVFQNNNAIKKQAGDLVILTPYSLYSFDQTINKYASKHYRLLFSAKFGQNIPKIGLKNIIKYFYAKLYPTSDFFVGQNNFSLPLYFYVYEVE